MKRSEQVFTYKIAYIHSYVAVGSGVQYYNQLRLEGPSFICPQYHGTHPVINTKQYNI